MIHREILKDFPDFGLDIKGRITAMKKTISMLIIAIIAAALLISPISAAETAPQPFVSLQSTGALFSESVHVKKVTLNKEKLTIKKGKTYKLKATISPSNASSKKTAWKSSNPKIVKVSSKGKLTALKGGKSRITVTTKDGGKKASCIVTVKSPVKKVKISKKKLNMHPGEIAYLGATVLPSDASNKKITWKSSNKSVVSVNKYGQLSAHKAGQAVITVTTKDGKKQASCTVTIQAKNSDITFSGNYTYNFYRDFMLSKSQPNKNLIFSPESLHTALDMYASLADADTGNAITGYLGKSYLAYKSTDAFKIVNRLWVNEAVEFNLPEDHVLNNVLYRMNMQDSGKATKEKDDFVSYNTNGFIDSTPTVLDKDTIFDAMNIIYFKDSWAGGDKSVDTKARTFYNADGTTTNTKMLKDSEGIYRYTDNAQSYTMAYKDGFTFTVILPDKGTDLSSVDIDAFINDNASYKSEADVILYMPEFEGESTYEMYLSEFGLPGGYINPSIYSGNMSIPEISQIAKIRVDKEGTEAAAVTEIIIKNTSVRPVPEIIELICDRPFLYYITDTANNDIAFIGAVNKIKG